MSPRPVLIVDTNVLVAGILTNDASAPTALIVDSILAGRVRILLSSALVAEYRTVLLRPRIAERHGLAAEEIDELLSRLALDAIVREPEAGPGVHGTDDDPDFHVKALLDAPVDARLVTGDRRLRGSLSERCEVLSPRDALALRPVP